MLGLVISLDYELPINKKPDVIKYMIKPTDELINICSKFGAKLTIMVEIGELWAFEKDLNQGFNDYLGYTAATKIKNQLINAIKLGHDVQLHLHPQWLDAKWSSGKWELDYSKYKLTDFDYEKMFSVFRRGKNYLDSLLCSHNNDYSCIGFRAGNWITQPSSDYLRALYEAGLKSDTSVFKWGYKNTDSVFYDYRSAHSNVLPWVACWDDINLSSKDGAILEFPIYAEPANFLKMLSVKRLLMAFSYFIEDRIINRECKTSNVKIAHPQSSIMEKIKAVCSIYPKKLDYCKLTSREMHGMLERIYNQFTEDPKKAFVPIMMIGHSKDKISYKNLISFLDSATKMHGDSHKFVTYRKLIREHQQFEFNFLSNL
jgi:hypothetical protein